MAQSRWSKPRYPLQVVLENENFLPDIVKRNSAVFSPSHLPADDYSDDQSSTGGLMSRSMTRTGDEDNASSTTLHSRNDLDPFRLHETSWSASGGTFHMLSTTDNKTLMRSPSLSTAGSDYALEPSLPGSFTPTHKTLKRTSRHRRIESPIPLSLDQEPSSIPTLPDWTQQTCPRESLAKASTFLQQLSSTKEGPFSPSEKTVNNGDYIGPLSQRNGVEHQARSTDHTATAAAPTPVTNIHQNGRPKTANGHLPQEVQEPSPNQAWRRNAYPLQMAADSVNLRSPPTPPPSPPHSSPADHGPLAATYNSHQEHHSVPACGEHAQGSRPSEHVTTKIHAKLVKPTQSATSSQDAAAERQPIFAKKALRRQAYPLQSSASFADLQGGSHAAGPEIGQSREDFTIGAELEKPDEVLSSTNNLKSTATSSSKQSVPKAVMRRQAYPLQSPASVSNLQQPIVQSHTAMADQSAKPSSQADKSKKTTKTEQEKQVERPKPKARKRQGYPLQAPASSYNLQDETVPTAPSKEEPRSPGSAVKQSAQPAESIGDDNMRTAPASFRRHGYPLQVSASTDNTLSASPVSSPKAGQGNEISYFDGRTEIYDEPDHMSQPQSPKSPTSPRSPGVRRRQTYPIQFIEDDFTEPPSPPPSTDDEDEDYYPGDVDKTKRILLPRHIPAIKSPEKAPTKGRTIVVCLDGTGDKFDNDNSNIVHIISALKKDDPHQVTYYQAGIGTYSANGLSKGFAAASDMAVGSGLGLHVRDAYHFLMHVYKENDRICIFGFSRGAYTARCLAGMIHKVGLLPPRNDQQIVFAYEFYKDNSAEGWEQSADFKKAFCINVNVHFLGCFDSVASVGFIPRQLPLSTTPTNKPRYFRHAMALDERRAKFKVCRHTKQNWDDIHPAHKGKSDEQAYRENHHPNLTDDEYSKLSGPDKPFDTDVVEVWFAGAHADVGGGAVLNTERHKLAQIPLRWMIRQAFECNTGILFKTRILAEFGLDVHTLWPRYSRLKAPTHGPPPSFLEKYNGSLPSRVKRKSKLIPTNEHENGEQLYHLKSPFDDEWTPEQVEDFYDAMMPINDQLIQVPTWWILETIPVEYKVPLGAGKCITRTGPNCGQYRGVEDAEPNLHWTVQRRMEHMGYKIQARTAKHTKWRIVV